MDTLILAIDLGKFNSVFCWYDPATRQAIYATVKSDPEEFRRRLASRAVSREPAMADTTRFTILCPCCEATLTIDAQTGALISHEEKTSIGKAGDANTQAAP